MKPLRAPRRQAVDTAVHGLAKEMPADEARQLRQLLGRFLHQKNVGAVALDQGRDVPDARPDETQQVPADQSQIAA